MGTKRAVLVGCNYPGTEDELRGCINDVIKMYRCLVERFGFSEEDINVLVDTDEEFTLPTASNVLDALIDMVSAAEPGDFLLFLFSGHGTRAPADEDDDDDTGYDESIVLCDGNLITDDHFRAIVNMVPPGCRITIISDSCHSGGLIEQAEEQIGDSTTAVDEEPQEYPEEKEGTKAKRMHFSRVVNWLRGKSGLEEIKKDQLKSVLTEVFGEDLSLKVNEFIKRRSGGRLMDASEIKSGFPENGVLISGCQTYQVSIDAEFDGEHHGVLVKTILGVLENTGEEISNRTLVTLVRCVLAVVGYDQKPGLYCSSELADAPFIG